MAKTSTKSGKQALEWIDQLAEAAIRADEAEESVARRQAPSTKSDFQADVFVYGRWVDRVMPFMRGVADGTRLRIVGLLSMKEPMEVGELAKELKIRSSTASQHLAILREAKVVVTEKKGIHTHCYLNRSYMTWRLRQLVDRVTGAKAG